MIVGGRLWAAASLLYTGPALAGGEAPAALAPVTLTIRNDSPETLRCAAVLAHFMSETLGAIGPGDHLAVTLRRDAATGALALAPRAGRDVPLENILCGRDTAWTASKGEMPLSALRAGPAGRYEAHCDLSERRVICSVADTR